MSEQPGQSCTHLLPAVSEQKYPELQLLVLKHVVVVTLPLLQANVPPTLFSHRSWQVHPGAQVGPADAHVPQPTQAPLVQLWPEAQHTLAQTVCPEGQAATAPAHVDALRLRHATPALQQACPQGDVPAGQQNPVAGSAQLSPFAQQPEPQVWTPAGHPQALVAGLRHATPALQQHCPQGAVPFVQGAAPAVVGPSHKPALARDGRSTVAAAAAANAAPIILRAPRRVEVVASSRLRSSNPAPMEPPVAHPLPRPPAATRQGHMRRAAYPGRTSSAMRPSMPLTKRPDSSVE
jgi:hypothetical protein